MCDLLTSSVAGGVALYRGVGNAQSATRHDKNAPARVSRGVARDARALDADSDSIRPVYPACTVGSKSDHDRFSAHVLRE
jgi:hypothetical protein